MCSSGIRTSNKTCLRRDKKKDPLRSRRSSEKTFSNDAEGSRSPLASPYLREAPVKLSPLRRGTDGSALLESRSLSHPESPYAPRRSIDFSEMSDVSELSSDLLSETESDLASFGDEDLERLVSHPERLEADADELAEQIFGALKPSSRRSSFGLPVSPRTNLSPVPHSPSPLRRSQDLSLVLGAQPALSPRLGPAPPRMAPSPFRLGALPPQQGYAHKPSNSFEPEQNYMLPQPTQEYQHQPLEARDMFTFSPLSFQQMQQLQLQMSLQNLQASSLFEPVEAPLVMPDAPQQLFSALGLSSGGEYGDLPPLPKHYDVPYDEDPNRV